MNCDRCPCRGMGEACPAIHGPHRGVHETGPHPHPRYCELVAQDPEYWGPRVLKAAVADRLRAEEDAAGLPAVAPLPKRRPSDPVRVGFWTPCFYRGGAEVWHQTLIPRLDRSRIKVVGMAVENPHLIHPDMVGMASELCPLSYGHEGMRMLASQCDVLVTWGDLDRAKGLRALTHRPKLVAVCHGDGNSEFTRRWIAEAVPHCPHLVACAEVGRPAFPEGYRERVRIITNGVDPTRIETAMTRREIRHAWGIPEDAPVVGYLGRLATGDKRADIAAQLTRFLPEPWWVVLVGDGFQRLWITALAGPRTKILPWIARPGDALRGFDWVINPSFTEGFGLSMGEAMLAQVPVVGTETGLAESGALVRPIGREGPPEEAARAILADAADDHGRRSRVRRAHHAITTRYSAARFAADWSDYLARLGGHAPSVPEAAGADLITGPPPWLEPDQANRILDNFSNDRRTLLGACAYRTVRAGCCGGPQTLCGLGPERNRGGRHFLADCVRCIAANLPRPDVGPSPGD